MAVKKGLGKGLDALIPEATIESKGKKNEENLTPDRMIKITAVEPNRDQPRKNFDEDALLELSDSIKQFGIIQPLVVQDRKNGRYEIIAETSWDQAR